jgi:sigma-B regulation protein RsbU (phosphoserine phosphatase)
MIQFSSINQRDIYKLVEKLTTGTFASELELLKSLVRDIVDYHEFEITGGRIWEFDSIEKVYLLRYQYGKLKKIPDNYKFPVLENAKLFEKLYNDRTAMSTETDQFLRDKGIHIYSVTGVGEIIKTRYGKYYKFLLSFNAPEILQSFFETLTVISGVATIALRNLIFEEKHQRMSKDIISASEIQRSLLPEHNLEFHDYNIYGICVPDEAVGGDYFDYLEPSNEWEENLGIIIGDAASKGLPAAIQALFVSGATRMAKKFSPKISNMLSALNTLIYDTFPFERFVTLFYCELTLSSNRLVLYANAGHCPPIHYHPDTGEVKFLNSTGGLLGLMQHQKFGLENIRMRPGDILVLYTDGITDSRDKNGELYGENRLIDMIKKLHLETSENIAKLIIEDVQKFTASSTYTDDKTIVVIKREGK